MVSGSAGLGGVSAGRIGSAWRPSWPLLSWLATYIYCFRHARRLLLDGDTLWHIGAGQWMFQHRTIPTSDPFSHTMSGTAWTAHEWLAEILLAAAHDAGGLVAVIALVAAAFATAIALLTRFLLRHLEPIYVVMFAAFAVMLSAGHLLARPHVLAMPLMVLWIAGIVKARDEGRLPRLWLLPVMVAWANMHGGFTLGLVIAAAFALEAVLAAGRGRRIAAARSWAGFLVAAVASALLTPHGPQGLYFTWHVLVDSGFALQRIAEWRSPDFRDFGPLELWLLGGLAAALYQGLRLPAVRLLVLLGLLHLALKHARYMELLGLLPPLFLAAPLAAQWRDSQRNKPQFSGADRMFARLTPPAGSAAILLAVVIAVFLPLGYQRVVALDMPESVAPKEALKAAMDARVQGPVLNLYAWGGYLIYAGVPPFIDGRADMYGDAFFKEYVSAVEPKSAGALQKLLDKHRVTWTLLPPESPAVALLDVAPSWRRLYGDNTAVVHIRIGTETPARSGDR